MKVIRSIQVGPDGVDLAYMDEGDVRLGGAVFQTHHISINRGSNYDDEIDTLEAAAEALLTDVLVDYLVAPPYVEPEPPMDDDEDEEDEDEEDEDD